jgi:hypothetical protein
MFEESAKNNDFFEVNCENPDDLQNCVGTFYVVLDTTSLSPEDYEKLPQIVVTNERTRRVIREPILPRGKFRLYVPLRYFVALAGARKISDAMKDQVMEQGDRRIGMCYNDCKWVGISSESDTTLCPGDSRTESGGFSGLRPQDNLDGLPGNPNEIRPTGANSLMRGIVDSLTGEFGNEITNAGFSDEFQINENETLVQASVDPVVTKTIQQTGDPGGGNYEGVCAKTVRIETIFAIQETNPVYKVMEKSDGETTPGFKGYKINIMRSFSKVPEGTAPCISKIETGQDPAQLNGSCKSP